MRMGQILAASTRRLPSQCQALRGRARLQWRAGSGAVPSEQAKHEELMHFGEYTVGEHEIRLWHPHLLQSPNVFEHAGALNKLKPQKQKQQEARENRMFELYEVTFYDCSRRWSTMWCGPRMFRPSSAITHSA